MSDPDGRNIIATIGSILVAVISAVIGIISIYLSNRNSKELRNQF